MGQIFIAREQQLKQLSDWLAQASAGHGRVCFVSGEAGSGKTTLVTEFTRRAQEKEGDLAVAVGLCDAQTGVGDAYLPFREVMGQLTGDVEAKLAQGAITQENAGRLQKMLALAGQAIVDVGPDLIGVFVPGVGLATKLGTFVAEKVGWLDKLEKLVDNPKPKVGESGIQESHIFEQFANVLCRIAEKTPLLIIVDDLHWGDAASINLLFHLGRRIEEHRIMILGTYRCAEVAIGRGGVRHPLEKVLAEFKRYYGDITIDLDKAVEEEGVAFVTELLGTEPNALEDDFKSQLYQHTGGHPLFTVELLRNMQERGDLVKDGEGKWEESESLKWDKMPTRVEGVIEERIGRLEGALKEVLTLGSVQGEDFTAEVVARVQQAEARGLIRQLSGELARQHRLVKAEGVRRIEESRQRLSFFRFQHNLFRTYLYNELSEAERAYLHEDVGEALEGLYGDQTDEIAVQLAHHYEMAEMDEKARYYLQKAGEQAAARYANEEAIDYFSRALALTPENDTEKQFELLMFREAVCGLKGEREVEEKDIKKLLKLAQRSESDQKLVEVYIRKSAFAQATGDFQSVFDDACEIIRLSEKLGDTRRKARGHLAWGVAATSKGDHETARKQLSTALDLSAAAGLTREESATLRNLASLSRSESDFENAMLYCERALTLASEMEDRLNASKILIIIGNLFSDQGDEEKAREYYLKSLPILREVGSRQNEAIVVGNLGCGYARFGEFEAALPYFNQSLIISQEVGDREMTCCTLGNLGELSSSLGRFDEAMNYLEQALKINQEIGFPYSEMIVLISMSSILLNQGKFSSAIENLKRALSLSRELNSREWEVRVLTKFGIIHDRLGEFNEAYAYFNDCFDITGKIDIKPEECNVWIAQGLLLFHLEKFEESRLSLLNGIGIAKKISDKDAESYASLYLGNTMAALDCLTDAEEYYNSCIQTLYEMGIGFLICEPQAGLARVAMKEGNPEKAQEYVEKILDFLEDHNLDGTDEPMRIYLTCYTVLQDNTDPRAEELLMQANKILLDRADKITDEGMRKSYLEEVKANVEIQKAFNELGKVSS